MSNSRVLKNVVWKFSERIAAQLVTFVVSIILARLLAPEDYGIVAIVTSFIVLANVFVSDSFGAALIQKREADEIDFSSVLFFNIAFSILLYLGIYLIAPWISAFYGPGYEALTPIFRVLGIRIIFAGVNSVQHAYISKKMEFKKFFWSTLFGTLLSAVVGILFAYYGFGVWALVAQYLTNSVVNTLVLCITSKMKIVPEVNFSRLVELISYGYKILLSKLLITGFQEIRSLIIGKLYTSDYLAFYDKGRQIPNLIVANIDTSIGAVLFPELANEQDDVIKLKKTTRNSIRFSSYILSPLMIGLMAVTEPLVRILLTDKWLPCVPYMQLFCLFYLFQPIHTANLQVIKAVGQSGTFLKLELIKKPIEIIVLLISMWYGVEAIVISQTVLAFLFTFINAAPNKKLINYSYREQINDIFPPIGMSLVMLLLITQIMHVITNDFMLIFSQILSGAILYVLLSVVTKNHEFTLIIERLKMMMRK